jgi:hypothetical protein
MYSVNVSDVKTPGTFWSGESTAHTSPQMYQEEIKVITVCVYCMYNKYIQDIIRNKCMIYVMLYPHQLRTFSYPFFTLSANRAGGLMREFCNRTNPKRLYKIMKH